MSSALFGELCCNVTYKMGHYIVYRWGAVLDSKLSTGALHTPVLFSKTRHVEGQEVVDLGFQNADLTRQN
jgi:hypothetical protein